MTRKQLVIAAFITLAAFVCATTIGAAARRCSRTARAVPASSSPIRRE